MAVNIYTYRELRTQTLCFSCVLVAPKYENMSQGQQSNDYPRQNRAQNRNHFQPTSRTTIAFFRQGINPAPQFFLTQILAAQQMKPISNTKGRIVVDGLCQNTYSNQSRERSDRQPERSSERTDMRRILGADRRNIAAKSAGTTSLRIRLLDWAKNRSCAEFSATHSAKAMRSPIKALTVC
jgi:hypothetical protein